MRALERAALDAEQEAGRLRADAIEAMTLEGVSDLLYDRATDAIEAYQRARDRADAARRLADHHSGAYNAWESSGEAGMSPRDDAVAAALRGRYVFPCRRDGDTDRGGNPAAKRPLVRRWEERASCDPEEVARFWPGPRFNVGIATGPSALVVLDLDPPDGELQLERARDGRDLPATYTVVTPRGGKHLYFTALSGREIRNSAGKIAPHVDVRGRGGYVIGAGSLAGGVAYTVADDRDPVPLPEWLALLAAPPSRTWCSTPPRTWCSSASRYGAGALRNEIARIEEAPPGTRNAQLNSSAWSLYRLVADGLLEDDLVTAQVLAAAGRCGLVAEDGETSVRRTIASARRAGLASPHLRRPA